MCVIEIGLNDQSFRPVHWACLFLFGLCALAAAPGSLARGGSGRAVSVVHAWLQIVQSHCIDDLLPFVLDGGEPGPHAV